MATSQEEAYDLLGLREEGAWTPFSYGEVQGMPHQVVTGPVVFRSQWYCDWHCLATGSTCHLLFNDSGSHIVFRGSLLDKVGYYPKWSRLVRRVLPTLRWYCCPVGAEPEILDQIKASGIYVIPSLVKTKTAVPWGTYLVDLQTDELLSSFDRSVRKNIKHSTCHIEPVTDRPRFLQTMYQVKKPFPLVDLYLDQVINHDGFLLQATYEGRIIAGLGVITGFGWSQEFWCWSLPEGYGRNAQDSLHWAAIQECHQRGHQVFDLGNCNPCPSTAKEAGILRYKAKCGTYLERYLWSC